MIVVNKLNEIDENKIDELIKKLTLEEKVSMVHGAGLFRTAPVERLGIPALKMSDGPMGVRHEFPDDNWEPIDNTDDFTSYLPSNSALAATWNPECAYKEGKILGREARGRGKDVILAPGVNIVRSPLCGRNFEYMSEDPYLTSKMAVPMVKGIEENDVSSCVKHFALNSQETERLNVNSDVDERTLREIYMPAFEAAITEGHASSIMPAYNKYHNVHCAHNKELLTDILRKEWEFKGITISDWGAVHNTAEAANAGLDIEMAVTPDFDDYYFARHLIEAVKKGEVKQEVIDEKVRRILRVMYKNNMFSKHRQKGSYNNPESRMELLDIARESIVLLKNNKRLLPLKEDKIKTLAVIGDNADIIQSNGGGSAEIKALYEITPLMGLKIKLGGNTDVKFAKGYAYEKENQQKLMEEAVELAKSADAVVMVGGLKHTRENFELFSNAISSSKTDDDKINIDSEGVDKTDMTLPYNQDELIKKVLEVNKNTVVVMMSGSPVDMTEWIDDADAVLWTSYNGMEGGRALADVIFGDVNPSGKLAVTIPRHLEDSPAHCIGEFGKADNVKYSEGIFVGYRYYLTKGIDPLFCFGHGLSYTDFKYSNINIEKAESAADVSIKVTFDLKNSGRSGGFETAQLYVAADDLSVEKPLRELKGFKKVYLKPGETENVEIEITAKDLAFYDIDAKAFHAESGCYKLSIGSSCEDIRVETFFELNNSYFMK